MSILHPLLQYFSRNLTLNLTLSFPSPLTFFSASPCALAVHSRKRVRAEQRSVHRVSRECERRQPLSYACTLQQAG